MAPQAGVQLKVSIKSMHGINIRTLDLNLLIVFDALMRERNLTAAARTLHLSQSATSHALARLRAALNDPLFIKTQRGMQPTPYAESIFEPIASALSSVQSALQRPSDFDPATTTRTFRLYMNTMGERLLVPALYGMIERVAPSASLECVHLPTQELPQKMEAGEIDLAFGFLPLLNIGMHQQTLAQQRYVCLVRADHPRIGPKITLDEYVAAKHVVVSAPGTGHDVLEQAHEKAGVKLHVALRLNNFLGLIDIISRSDLVATVPIALAESLSMQFRVCIMPAPIKLPTYEVKQHWHARFHQDPGNQWLRRVSYDLFAGGAAFG